MLQTSLFNQTGKELATCGMELAKETADQQIESWSTKAYENFKVFIELTNEQFLIEDFRAWSTMMDYWANSKKVASQKIKTGGISICCGWNNNGFGKGNGFEMLEILIVAHGGSKNDTIVTVERKFTNQLFQ